MHEKLTPILESFFIPGLKSGWQTYNYGVRLLGKLVNLQPVAASADFAPTQQAHAVFAEVSAQVDAQLDALHQIMEFDVAGFNSLVREQNVDPLGSID